MQKKLLKRNKTAELLLEKWSTPNLKIYMKNLENFWSMLYRFLYELLLQLDAFEAPIRSFSTFTEFYFWIPTRAAEMNQIIQLLDSLHKESGPITLHFIKKILLAWIWGEKMWSNDED